MCQAQLEQQVILPLPVVRRLLPEVGLVHLDEHVAGRVLLVHLRAHRRSIEFACGVIFCAEGVATFICHGIGNMTEAGGVSFRGGASFETTSEALSELNGKYYMFSYESDPEGNAEWNLYPCI